MKFAADRMLGRLAKWLRILGYDTIYDVNMDATSVSSHLRDGRIVLTRGRRFRSGPSKGVVWMEYDHVDEQLRQLVEENWIDMEGKPKFLLCSRCNTKLLKSNHREAEGHVPEYVMHSQKSFLRCPSCHRFYWSGTHLKRMNGYIQSRVMAPRNHRTPAGGKDREFF